MTATHARRRQAFRDLTRHGCPVTIAAALGHETRPVGRKVSLTKG